MSSIEYRLEKAKKFFREEISLKIEECSREGHKEISLFAYSVTSRSTYEDKVHGKCEYCKSPLIRFLNDSERRNIGQLQKSLHKLFTI